VAAEIFPWHPLLVPWPLGFLTAGLIADLAMSFEPRARRWLSPASSALLWGGTAGLWAAVALGFGSVLDTAPALFGASLTEHRFLALWASGLFTGLSYWRWASARRASALFSIAWLASTATLWAAAWKGFGLGHP